MNSVVYCVFAVAVICQLYLFFRDREYVVLKVITSSIVIVLVGALATSFTSWLGWPAEMPTIGKFQIIKVMISNAVPGKEGRIYAWMIPADLPAFDNPFTYVPAADSPRGYAITPSNEKTMQKAEAALADGKGVFITFGTMPSDDKLIKKTKNPFRQDLNDPDTEALKITIIEPEGSLPPKD